MSQLNDPQAQPAPAPNPPAEPTAAELRKRVLALENNMEMILDQVAVEVRPCKACNVKLWFVRTKAGKILPLRYDGTSHFADCPKADQFRRKG